MKKCDVRPYAGEQKYIYVAYSLKDKRFVYPVIEQLAKDGYRVWYDDGLIYGADTATDLADKIARSHVIIAFFSDNTADSYPFKREINYAILKKKEIIAVMLDEVHLSPGMEMQMSAFPAIFKYKIENHTFYKSLYSFEIMNMCLGEPDNSIVVSDEDKYRETLADLFGADEHRKPVIDDAAFMEQQTDEGEVNLPRAVLIKITTNEEIKISTPKMIIGRAVSEKSKPIVDYSIETNSMISRFHAVITLKNKEFYLVDCGAVNKTFLNGEELEINKEYLLHDGDVIKLANEKFRFRRLEV